MSVRDDRGRFASTAQSSALEEVLAGAFAGHITELVLEIESNVREATPIDTGFAAASWIDSVGEPVADAAADVAAALAAQSAGQVDVIGYRLGMGDVFVSNPTDYIEALNDGHSPQADAGFIEREADRAVETVQARHDAEVNPL